MKFGNFAKNAEFDPKCDVVFCYFQIGVEQSIILCKKKSSWISSIALKRNKENWLAELGEQSDLLAFKVVVVVVVAVVVGWGEGVGISVTSVSGSELCVGVI